ncbi:MAG TPA: GAF domain-containing sensor histidine kinase [Thermoanaerobaculia bacterium]|nr:GAF domain-containing sensor histidine kinase [Thermoanaerobaculia bacterium]
MAESVTDLGETTLLGRRVPISEMPRSAVLSRWIIGLGGLMLLPAIILFHPPITLRHFLVFATFMVLAEVLLTVRVGPGSFYSVSQTFLFVYFVLGGGVAAATMEAVVHFISWVVQRFRRGANQTPLFALFDIGHKVLGALLAAFITAIFYSNRVLAHPIPQHPVGALTVFAIAYFAVTVSLKSIAVWTRAGFSEMRSQLWPKTVLWDAISTATCLPFAIVITLLAGAILYGPAAAVIGIFLAGVSLILRLNVNLRQGNDELKAVNRIGTLINATLDLSQLFSIIAIESSKVVPWDAFFIALAEKESPAIQIIFMTKGGSEITQRTIPRGAGLTGRAISTGELIVYEQQESGVALDDEGTLGGKRRPRSIVVAPMKFGDKVIGAISVQSFQSNAYRPSQSGVLQTIAAQAAIAIRNAQLFASEERARVERDEFFSLVTHEIKNPLTSVQGYADIVEMELAGGNISEAQQAVQVVKAEARKILRLMEDLLDSSKMQAGKFTIRKEPTDLSTVVSTMARKYDGRTDHTFTLKIADDLPTVYGDETRLGQVVENLVSNAVKYSPEKTPIQITLWFDASAVYCSVADKGLGVSPEKLPLIFERFYRVEEGGAEVKGTGLGLFISRQIARMHGGEIRVKSRVGEGSVFTLELPRKAN